MASFTESKHPMFPLHLFPLPSVCPGVIIFFKEPCLLMTCLNRGTFIFVVFASSDVSGFVCSRIHFFIFLNMDQGTHRALL